MARNHSAKAFAWRLTQERVDMVAHVLYKAETLLNIAVPGSLEAENIGHLITDLRAQCCVRDGAADPLPDTPMFSAFASTLVARDPLVPARFWVQDAMESEAA